MGSQESVGSLRRSTENDASPTQNAFRADVRGRGGIAGVTETFEDFGVLLSEFPQFPEEFNALDDSLYEVPRLLADVVRLIVSPSISISGSFSTYGMRLIFWFHSAPLRNENTSR